MTANAGLPVLIAGGGIGGLSAAVALARRSIAAHVLEAEAVPSESGAGIQIGPNGSRILRAWGLGEALEVQAARPREITIGDGLSGRIVTYIPLGREAEARYGAPYYVVERRLLHRLLLETAFKAPNVTISTGFRVTGLRNADRQITAISDDGREIEGSALVGADGIHSRVRSHHCGQSLAFSGLNAWRATASLTSTEPHESNAVQLWLGPKAHLVHYLCGPDGPLNAVAVTAGEAASPGWGTEGDARELMAAFEGWAEAPRRILARFKDWMIWPLLKLPPLPRWSDGASTLLGDAAHPLMPFLASGAVMAIEDAEVLAAALTRAKGDASAAFAKYEARRKPRVEHVQRASSRMGEIYHMSGAMRLARNLTLGAMPQSLLLRRNDWLYGYCAEDSCVG